MPAGVIAFLALIPLVLVVLALVWVRTHRDDDSGWRR
jgi:hypothetical protein